MLAATALLAAATLAPGQESGVAELAARAESVWLCPRHPEVHRDAPGTCAVCRRPLERRSISWRWFCPMHPLRVAAQEGACPICGMARVPTTVEVVWRCAAHPDVLRHEPGPCPHDARALKPQLRPLAHGDHNPRHGGLFFMAPDRFHHLEGVLRGGRFRVYLYDDYTRPLQPAGVRARLGPTPLAPSDDGAALEASVATGPPVELVLFVDFGRGEQRFDFVFGEETELPPLPELVVPAEPDAIRAEIARRDARLRELMRLGIWGELHRPALQARELALALQGAEPGTDALAVKRIVRGAWLLDLYGDLGNRRQVESAYALFAEGLATLGAAESVP